MIYANLFRFSPAPLWSDNDWYMKSNESGGVFDMHIHDIDVVALWLFGKPDGDLGDGIGAERPADDHGRRLAI